jgi:hypothetical protein
MYGGLSYTATDTKQYAATAIGSSGGAWMVEVVGQSEPVHLHVLSAKDSKTSASYSELIPQVCNPSVSSSRIHPDAMMYLDFGSGGRYHDFINNGEAPWGVHEIIVISNYSGQVVRYFQLPSDIVRISTKEAGELKSAGGEGGAIVATAANTYEFPEWSNHPYFGVTCVQTDRLWWKDGSYVGDPSSDIATRQRNEYIYGINLNTKEKIRLVHTSDTLYGRTTSYRWAGMWVDTLAGFSEEEQWLKTAKQGKNPPRRAYVRPSAPVKAQSHAAFDGKVITADEAITRIELHNMVGRVMQVYSPAGFSVKSIVAGEAFSVKNGVYFVRVETSGGSADVFRWVVTAPR